MTGPQFLDLLAEQLIHELQPNRSIKEFADNTAIKGAYAEAAVRQFVSRTVAPLRVSTGAVISEQLCARPKEVPQIDLIIWTPSPAPAVFCSGDFALVPRSSCFGIMEIKRSLYSEVGSKISKVIGGDEAYKLVSDVAREVERKVQFPGGASSADFTAHPGLGVVCVQEYKQSNQRPYDDLEQAGIASTLFREGANGELVANPKAVFRLINFLVLTKLRARMMEGQDLVNVRLLNQDGVEVALPKTTLSFGTPSQTNTPIVIGPLGAK